MWCFHRPEKGVLEMMVRLPDRVKRQVHCLPPKTDTHMHAQKDTLTHIHTDTLTNTHSHFHTHAQVHDDITVVTALLPAAECPMSKI